jgi:formiminoglutamate deiminase
MEKADTALFFEAVLLPDGWAQRVRITISNGRFLAVTTDTMPEPGDERHGFGIPGIPNLHSHAVQRGMAGLAERRGPTDDSFWTWRTMMYRFVDRITPDQMKAIATLAYVEMLESGFTRVGEFHYLHHDRDGRRYGRPAEMSAAITAAAARTGIGLTHLPVFYAHSGFGGLPPGDAQRRFVHAVDDYVRLVEEARASITTLPDAIVGVAPHSLRAVMPEELHAVTAIAGNAPIHIHIAEQIREVEDCLAWSGARPVQWLLDHADVDDRWCLVHATHIDAGEQEAIVRSNAVVGLCPVTEANLGDGLFPAHAFDGAGGRYGIGSDSNVLIDMAEELRLLEYGQRLFHQRRNVMARGAGKSTGQALFDAALSGGAQALGVKGGIAPGLPADLIGLDRSHPSLCTTPMDMILDAFIFAAGRSAIDCVWRYGAKVVAQGRHRLGDMARERYRIVIQQIKDS